MTRLLLWYVFCNSGKCVKKKKWHIGAAALKLELSGEQKWNQIGAFYLLF